MLFVSPNIYYFIDEAFSGRLPPPTATPPCKRLCSIKSDIKYTGVLFKDADSPEITPFLTMN